jgi:hypothetical protein
MEKFPNINKVDGSVPLVDVENQLENDRKNAHESYEDSEIKATEEELQVIDAVSLGLKVMFEYVYKIDCKEILKDRIHIVKEGTLSHKYGRGMYSLPSGDIYLEPLTNSKIVFAKTLAHELVHYLSFNSVKVHKKDEKVYVIPHTDGLSIIRYDDDGIKAFFNIIDEALTSYISNEFLKLELNLIRSHPNEKLVYSNERLAVDTIRKWLHGLPDSVDLDKKEWDKYYIVSIPSAEEVAEVINSNVSAEEKIEFYKKKVADITEEEKSEYYLERTGELEDMLTEINSMFAAKDPGRIIDWDETLDFVNKIISLKLTGKGFLDIVRLIESKLGSGSFKKLAEKFKKTDSY